MPMNDPPPPRTISRAECLRTYMVPLMFRSTVRRHASESIWVTGPIVSLPPAQCTTPCNRPVQAVAASTARNFVLVGDVGGFVEHRAASACGLDLVCRASQPIGVAADEHPLAA